MSTWQEFSASPYNHLPMLHIDDLLHMLVASEASDLHLRVGEPPVMRIHGDLKRVPNMQPMTDRDMYDLLYVMMNEDRKVRFEQNMELDMSYAVPGLARFRVNIFRQQGHIGAVMRVIPFKIRTIDELMLPEKVKELCLYPRGLILVTGPTGSGKSTSLAAMVTYINGLRPKHIITIEDPIEYLHKDNLSAVNQREVGVDTHSFAAALKHVMRQNPDIILVGEMRDLETISLAITAAETGHLVFGTLHTTDAPQTVDRIIDVFEPDAQQQVRMQLSTTLQAVLSQTLLPRADGNGRVAAFELMVATPAIRTLIREGKTYQMYTDIQTGAMHGMQTLDSHLLKLVMQKLITFEDGQTKSSNPADFEVRYKRALERGTDLTEGA
jgi:twitching motility protein PilT